MKVKISGQVWTEVVQAVFCNKCGEKCDLHEHFSTYYYAGYNAKVFSDGDEFGFELCEACLNAFMGTFKIPAKVNLDE